MIIVSLPYDIATDDAIVIILCDSNLPRVFGPRPKLCGGVFHTPTSISIFLSIDPLNRVPFCWSPALY